MNSYNPDLVKTLGTLLSRIEGIQPTTVSGTALIAVMDRGLNYIALDVTDPRDYAAIYDRYAQGFALTFDVYRLPQSELAKCLISGSTPTKQDIPAWLR